MLACVQQIVFYIIICILEWENRWQWKGIPYAIVYMCAYSKGPISKGINGSFAKHTDGN